MYRLIHPFNYKSVIEKKLSLFHFILESSPLCNTCYSLLGTQLYNIRQNYWIITTQFSCKDIKLIYSLKKWKKTCFEELVEQTCLIDLWSPGTRSLFCRIEQLNWISKTITIFLTEHVPKNQLPWNTVEVSIVPFLWRRKATKVTFSPGQVVSRVTLQPPEGEEIHCINNNNNDDDVQEHRMIFNKLALFFLSIFRLVCKTDDKNLLVCPYSSHYQPTATSHLAIL